MERLKIALWGVSLLLLAVPAAGVDGVIEINQAAVFAGGITPGDTPGFPVLISQSGSYRLTGNLDVTKKQDGSAQANSENITAIGLRASHISIDLNGFSIFGPGQDGDGYGIREDDPDIDAEDVTVVNGTISGMGNRGIESFAAMRVERVTAIGNGGVGIFVGAASHVTDCTVKLNKGGGISLASGHSVASGNTVTQNQGSGIFASINSLITDNVVTFNSGFGLEFSTTGAYAGNLIQGNTSGTVLGGGVQIGTNFCDGNTICP